MRAPDTALERRGGETALERRRVETALRLPPERQRRSRRERLRQGWRQYRQSGECARQAIVAAPLAAIAFAILAFGGVYGWAYGSAYGLIFAALAAWATQCWRGRLRADWRPIYWPVLLFGLVVMAQCVAGRSVVPASTATAALHLGAAGALFLVISQSYRGARDAGWITAAFAIFTAVLALLAILQILTASNGIYWHFTYTYASPAGSFVNRNHFSGCMEMLLPAACVQAYQRRRRAWLQFLPWVAAPGLGIAAVVLAASRGGAIALAAEGLAALLLLLYLGSLKRLQASQRAARAARPIAVFGWLPLPAAAAAAGSEGERRQASAHGSWRARRASDPLPGSAGPARWLTLGAAVGLTVLLIVAVGSQRLQARLQDTNFHAPSVTQRDDLNRSSLAMFRERPVMGWGLGTWADIYPAFARFTDTDVFAFAHNDYLQMLAETGVAGAGCAVLFWLLWGWGFLARTRVWRHRAAAGQPTPTAAPLAVAAAISCLGILVHSWVDYNLHIPANLLLFFTLAALAYPPRFYEPNR